MDDIERSWQHAQQPEPAGSLFETFADKVLRRVDNLIAGRDSGPWELDVHEKRFLELIRSHQGKTRCVPIGEFCERMRVTPRVVKGIVQALRQNHNVQIGASRDAEAGGYYLVASFEESVESTEQMFAQAVTMLRVVAKMRGGRAAIDHLLRQLTLALAEEEVPRG